MDVNTLTTLISSIGFPIACCVYLGYYINTTMKEFTATMNRNNILIERLIDKLDGDANDKK